MPDVETLIAQFEAEQHERLADFVLQLRAVTAGLQPTVPTRFEDRDRLVVDCHRRFYFAAGSTRASSEQMARELQRYAGTAWIRDRIEVTCPERLAGKPQGDFWAILELVPRSLSGDRIRAILAQIEVSHGTRQFDSMKEQERK